MTNYLVRVECAAQLDESAGPHPELTADFDVIADALLDLEDIHDQDLTADLVTGILTFSIGVVSNDEFDALDRALGAVRTALHAAGRGTPGWERQYRMLRQEVEEEPIGAI